MVKTFKAGYVKEKSGDPAKDITAICDQLRKNGFIPQGITKDDNFWHVSGNIDCRCADKFDKAYCDGEGNCNNSYERCNKFERAEV